MPIYEWKCKKCEEIVEVLRPVSDWSRPPAPVTEAPASPCEHDWVRWLGRPPSVPFQTLRNRGIFMDENGNYPPSKME